VDQIVLINKRVDVVAVFRRSSEHGAICWPHKMRYQGHEIVFTELGLRHPTSQGKRMIHVFDMSDGINDYRLEFDAQSLTWVLVAMLGDENAL